MKKLGIILSVILVVVCVAIDAWWISVKNYAPDKIIDNTIHASTIESVSGREENIFEVNYYSNRNKNGLEMFELKTSYLTDTDGLDIHAQGMQFVANNIASGIEWQYGNFMNIERYDDFPNAAASEDFWSRIVEPKDNIYSKNDNVSSTQGERYDALFQKVTTNSLTSKRYDYASGDNFETVYNATTPLSMNSALKIQIKNETGESEVFGMAFRGERNPAELHNQKEEPMFTFYKGYNTKWFWRQDIYGIVFPYFDENYLAHELYKAVKDMKSGTETILPIEFGDWFNFYTVSNGVLTDIRLPEEQLEKIKQNQKSYFSIKVTVSADGAQHTSDSMFGMVQGSPNFNLNGEVEKEDYFYGRSIIEVKTRNFEPVEFGDGHLLKLKEDFLKRYIDYKGLIQLSIEIDLDTLDADKINFLGFASESGLENFNILEIYKVRIIDGEVSREEVKL